MYIDSYSTSQSLKYMTDYFLKCNKIEHFIQFFDICISDNLNEDYKKIYPNQIIKNTNYEGFTIPPHMEGDKIIILIAEDHVTPDIVFHELSHMEDMVLFAFESCNGCLYKIRNHPKYQLFIYWTEFHVKLIDIPYSIIFIELTHSSLEQSYKTLSKEIRSRLYLKFSEDIINKIPNISLPDIMWYLGKLIVCNLYDNENTYFLNQSIVEFYPLIVDLYSCMKTMVTFEEYHVFGVYCNF